MSEIIQTLSRVRRAMPRNQDVMALCDALEKLMARSSVVERHVEAVRAGGSNPSGPTKSKLTRAQIQKRYRERKRRKAAGTLP